MKMTPKKIYSIRPEIRKQVLESYPVTKHEKNCALEKQRMEGKRAELAKRLYAVALETN